MAYHVHKTPGIVLQTLPSGEANIFLTIFTRELGLVKATAQGARLGRSKMRYGLQKYDVSLFSFVYGKNIWRLTGAVPVSSIYYDFKKKKEELRMIASVCLLLQRLMTGEEQNIKLFDLFTNAVAFLDKSALTEEEIGYFEFLFVLRILYNLGYISGSSGLEVLALGSQWDKGILQNLSSYKREAISAINRAILESQL